ncbi:MipA/OmpV family protein [Niveibacterium sp. 24ML]|uniref:MipA/OmpV family protein n=1 Tax=Niveibacterium sp. 24ML TaxID=2985512 RepID=UPI0022706D80|nr:MipA/OmpV family protein [Niveibacterium sp. 24ML]MCX9156273.1 MipA/OmpV family protein [Niveibacterium sp. 24ML]
MPRSLRRSSIRVLSIALLASASLSAPLAAELDLGSLQALVPDTETSPVPRGLVLGGVFIGANARYIGQDDTALPIPGAVYFGEHFMYLGDRARYYVYNSSPVSVFGYGRVRFGNLDPEDTAELAGMHRREGQFELGIGANVVTPYALLTLRAAADVTGTSEGGEALMWADFPVVRDRWLIMPGFGLLWRSSKLANYYFGGVAADEARAGRPQHDTGSTWSPMASLITTYRFDKHWLGTVSAAIEHFDSGTAESPIVDHENELTLITGVGYIW